mmetsp:Transcript_22146/g.49255  ORF Transcript_22146/g.49255 Transcript_22146/m.49255 type:complete len:334 (+) Transcript_22146:5419-6420(+)
MRERVLQSVCELEGINVAQAVLYVRVYDQLGQAQDLPRQVEGVTEPRFLSLLGGERLGGLEVEVVVQVQVVEVLAVDEQVEHVVALPAHLQSDLYPVQLGRLEELRGLQGLHETLLGDRLGRLVVQAVEHPALEQLLIGDAHLDGVVVRAVLLEPLVHKGHVVGTPRQPGALVERPGGPVERDAERRVVSVERLLVEDGVEVLGQGEVFFVQGVGVLLRAGRLSLALHTERADGVDDGVEVEGRQVGVVGLDVVQGRVVVGRHVYRAGAGVVQEGEGDAVLGAQLVADDDLVDVVELIPVLVVHAHVVPVQRFELRPTRDCEVERLGGVEALV